MSEKTITLAVPVTEEDIERIEAGEWIELETGEGLTFVLGSPDTLDEYSVIKEWLGDESDGQYAIETRSYSGERDE